MSDLLVEVDEALKQERLEKLWQNYGGFFIGVLAMLILGTAGNAGYKHLQNKKNIAQTDIYLEAAINADPTTENLTNAAKKIENTSLKSIAKIYAAGLATQEKDTQTAITLYDQNKNTGSALSGLSTLMVINQNASLSADQKLTALKKIHDDLSNPWKYHAHLESALINANINKDYQTARLHLKEIISATGLPETLQKKAQSLDILYALKAKK